MHELAIDGVCRFCRRNILVEASENMSAPALSPEERAERAWSAFATEYYVPDEPLVSDSTLFKAGYLAALKETDK